MKHSSNQGLRVSILSILLVLSAGTIGATTIGTADLWNGHSGFGKSVGESGPNLPGVVATWGQTFTVPNDSPILTSFSFVLRDDPLIFGGYLMQWDGHKATGPVLYESGPVTLVEDTDWHLISFDPLKILLTPGQQYVFFMSASKYYNGYESGADIAGLGFNAYTGGAVVNLDNGTDTSKWTTENWYVDPSSWDNTFSANFAAVPESSNASVLFISLAFLTFAGIRRKHADANFKMSPGGKTKQHLRKHRLHAWALFLPLAMSVGPAVATETTISTFPDWFSGPNPTAFETLWGEPNPLYKGTVPTYGQTFTAPNDNSTLIDFTFGLHDQAAIELDPLVFGGYLMQWNGQRAVGPVLYDSGPMTLSIDSYSPFTFNSLNLALIPNQQYVFIISASKYFDGIKSSAWIMSVNFDSYAGGEAVYLDNGTDTSKWTTEDWQAAGSPSWDMAFTANFAPAAVPDPAHMNLLAISATFLALEGFRRRHAVRA